MSEQGEKFVVISTGRASFMVELVFPGAEDLAISKLEPLGERVQAFTEALASIGASAKDLLGDAPEKLMISTYRPITAENVKEMELKEYSETVLLNLRTQLQPTEQRNPTLPSFVVRLHTSPQRTPRRVINCHLASIETMPMAKSEIIEIIEAAIAA